MLNRNAEKPWFLSREQVSQLLSTKPGQFLLSHPALAHTLLLFVAFAVLPVALFLAFAVVTFIISATGFVFFQGRCDRPSSLTLLLTYCGAQLPTCRLPPPGLLLFVGGMSLLCVLVGVAFFSVVVSLIFNLFYFVLSSILRHPQLTKVTPQFGHNRGRIPKCIFPLTVLFSSPSSAQSPGGGGGKVKAARGSVMDTILSTGL